MASSPETPGSVSAGAKPAYAELQVTSNFSFLRGASRPDELVMTAAALGHPAIAITDRNSLAGIVRAHHAAKVVGIRLLVGCRLDLRDGTALLAYPEDRAAYGRLTRLLTLGRRRAPKGECHLDYDDLVAQGAGQIVVLLPPEENTPVALACHRAAAERVAADFPGRAYLAAHHLYRGDDARRLARLAVIADETGLPLLAVNDVLYHAPERRPLQDVVTCIREGCTVADAGFRLLANAERHLKAPGEMARLFRGHEQALGRSLEIVERCRFGLHELRYEYPEEPVPAGMTPQQRLAELAWAGAAERFSTGPLRPSEGEEGDPSRSDAEGEVGSFASGPSTHLTPALSPRERAERGEAGGVADRIPKKIQAAITHELALIERLDYARYFLTVHDIVHFARRRKILCQGRGSAANSVVCYCLGITSISPDLIDVLFERFISAARNEPPDIDVDFEHERREEVIQYIYAKYGRDRAGLAATVICYRARGAIREVGKALGLSGDVVAALAGIVWGWSNEGIVDDKVREAGLDPRDRTLRLALDLAAALIGFPRHLSQHVGGFVITRGPLSELVPITNAAMADRTVIEWDKDDLDTLGILKVDVLALGMLTCVRKAFDLIEAHKGERYTLASVPPEQAAVYKMLSRADSLGVFQVESRAQMTMLPRLKPKKFYDLVIEVAIVRPGPIQGDMVHPYLRRRAELEDVEYPSEALRQVLEKTLGVPLFQEQAMRIAIVGAGFSPEDADRLRRAMATFKHDGDIHLFREKFVTGMTANGYSPDFATRCFNQIEGFGTYGFPESHAASFALLVYVSAWIKCVHPDVFACALLNSQPMGFYAPAQIVRDARDHGVEIRPVDINHSFWDCTLEPLGAEPPNPSPVFPSAVFPVPSRTSFVLRGSADAVPAPTLPLTRAPPSPVATGEGGGGGWHRQGNPVETCPTVIPPRTGIQGRSNPQSELAMAGLDPAIRVSPTHARQPGEAEMPESSPGITRKKGGNDGTKKHHALRLGFRQIKGFAEADAAALVAAREDGYPDPAELWRRSGLARAALERLADADALRSIGVDRRRALWSLKALGAPPLPLFAAAGRAAPPQDEIRGDALLPEMPLGEHVVEDYASLSMSLKRHPLAFLRAELSDEGLVGACDLATLPVGRLVAIAGLVLIRQRPGSANGVVFITIEDETGVANLIVWPAVLERFRRAALGATLLYCRGRLQREQSVIHIVADDLRDRTALLRTLRDRPGTKADTKAGTNEGRSREQPSFVLPEKVPGYDARDIVVPSRNFR